MDQLTDQELRTIKYQDSELKKYQRVNKLRRGYYEGKSAPKDLGAAIPPRFRHMKISVDWPRLACDVLNQKISFEGWLDEEKLGLTSTYEDNHLESEARLVHLDALRFGVGYVTVYAGDTSVGEPEVLITAESPDTMVAIFDIRLRRVVMAYQIVNCGKDRSGTLFTEEEIISFSWQKNCNPIVTDRQEHSMGRCPVVMFHNRRESSSQKGHSEISEPVMDVTNRVQRTLLACELNREYHSNPQRYLLGASKDDFIDADGNQINPMSIMMDQTIVIAGDPEKTPTIGQFSSNPPDAYTTLLREYGNEFSGITGIPADRLGYSTVNPTSGDAIRQQENGLNERAEERVALFSRSWEEVARLALIIKTGSVPAGANLGTRFREVAAVARSAAADEITKLTAMKIFPIDSSIVYDRIGLTRAERKLLSNEIMRAEQKANAEAAAIAAEELKAVAAANINTVL